MDHDAPAMSLSYFRPAPSLAEFLGEYYIFSTRNHVYQPICAELGNIRFVVSGSGRIHWPDGRAEPVSGMTVVGPTMAAYAIEAEPGTRVIGVGVQPRGRDALFGFSAQKLLDRSEDLSSHLPAQFKAGASACFEAVRSMNGDPSIVEPLDAFFASVVEQRRGKLRRFPVELESWLLTLGTDSIDDLARTMNVSRRQLDRLSKYFFGASPKALKRKYRALHALDQMVVKGADGWAEAAGEAFYDQSHFIREFKEFVGATPREFLLDQAVLLARSIELRARATHQPAIDGAPPQ